MKIRQYFALAAAALVAGTAVVATAKTKAPKDDVLMTVNGKDVMLSEFEYLYHKNNAQQLQPQTLPEYLETFTVYKLKVADAEAAKMDTLPSFIKEFTDLERDLSKPYMTDSTVINRLIDEAYGRYAEERDLYHLMVPGQQSQLADSLLGVLRANPQMWDSLVAKYSVDPGSKRQGGRLFWRRGGTFPYKFEEAAWKVPVGQISDVVNSGFGLHIIKVEGARPNQGDVRLRHVLRFFKEGADSANAANRHIIDSLYRGITAGDIKWEEAATLSNDRASIKSGGVMDWAGYGQLPVPFDSIVFNMPLNVIDTLSMPWGWHVLEKIEQRPMLSRAEMKADLIKAINSDERGRLPEQERIAQLTKTYKGAMVPETFDVLKTLVVDTVGLDSANVARLQTSDLVAFRVEGRPTTLGAVITNMKTQKIGDPRAALRHVPDVAREMMEHQLTECYRRDLGKKYPDYRNLLAEYHDGILFFNVTNDKVYTRATEDTEGLERYFQQHRDAYTWDKPRFKGVIIMATTDSVMTLAKDILKDLPADLAADSLSKALRAKLGRNVRVEANVVAAQGDHPVVDYVAFNGPKPDRVNGRWDEFLRFSGRMVEQPENAHDVRGLVITDYQNELDRQYIQALKDKYPVTVNRKVLKKAK